MKDEVRIGKQEFNSEKLKTRYFLLHPSSFILHRKVK